MSELTDRCVIPGYEGLYEIDNKGNVYAMFAHHRLPSGRMKRALRRKSGYLRSALFKDGEVKYHYIHRLVMLAFCPIENSDTLVVNHIDGNKLNNDLSNLEWVTPKANMLHARRVLNAWAKNGMRGERVIFAKLTEADVREIRLLSESKIKTKDLARRYGVSEPSIRRVARRETWTHVK